MPVSRGFYNRLMPFLVTAALMLVTSLPSPPRAQQPPPDVIGQAGAVLAAIVAADFTEVEEQFTPDMKAALPPGRLAVLWTALLSKAGAYKGCSPDPRVKKIADKQMVITACEFERMTADIQFAFDAAGRISGLVFRPGVRASVPYTLPSYAR